MGYIKCRYCDEEARYKCDKCGKHLCRNHVVEKSGWFSSKELCQACADED